MTATRGNLRNGGRSSRNSASRKSRTGSMTRSPRGRSTTGRSTTRTEWGRRRRLSTRRYRCAIQAFLNRPGHHGRGNVLALVEDTSRLPLEPTPYSDCEPDIRLEISDCGNTCRFEFPISSAEQRENSLFKIDQLVSCLLDFRDALEDEIDLFNQREEERAGKERGR